MQPVAAALTPGIHQGGSTLPALLDDTTLVPPRRPDPTHLRGVLDVPESLRVPPEDVEACLEAALPDARV